MTTAIDIDTQARSERCRPEGLSLDLTVEGGFFFFFFHSIGKLLLFSSCSLNTPPAPFSGFCLSISALSTSASFHFTFKIEALSKLVLFSPDIFL